ncbi:5621_t:CDS:2 [Entrophospora sp. SA101]|nr:5621_t:CDS:2 [Entrophospora sp. SA101]
MRGKLKLRREQHYGFLNWKKLIAETDYTNKPKSKKQRFGTLAQLGTENGYGLGTNRRKWIKE